MCDTINPVSNVYCQECTARLVPMTATPEDESEEEAQPIKGVSLPTIPLDEEEQDQERSPHAEEESSTDDWLDDLRESADDVVEGAEDSEDEKPVEEQEKAIEPAEIPDWLHETGSGGEESHVSRRLEGLSSDEASEETADPANIHEEELDLAVPEVSAPEDETSPEGDESSLEPADIPDWLRELRDEQREPLARSGEELSISEGQTEEGKEKEQLQAEELPAEQPELEELPEWLQETIGSATEAEAPSERDEAASASEEPLDRPEEAPTIKEEPQPDESPPEEAEPVRTPEWLQDVGQDQEETLPEEAAVAFTESPPETFDPPEWLRDLMEEDSPDEEEPSPFSTRAMFADEESSGTPQPADIPHWLRDLRPSEVEQEETPDVAPETEGLLTGLRGLIPPSPGIEAPASYQFQSAGGTTEASQARAELLQSLLGQPHPTPRPELEKKPSDIGRRVERWVVTAVLLVAVMGMLLVPLLGSEPPRLTQPGAASGAARLYEIVNGLDAGDNVLIAFDYGPPEADELDTITEPVIEHLINSGGDLSIVSTRPDAPPVAAALMNKVTDSNEQYTLLGYRPGGGIAVSHLLAATDQPPKLLVILTSRPGPLLRWVEQVQARYEDQIQLAAVTSALLEPVTSPYLDANARQLDAAIHGVREAASYEALQGRSGEATRQLDTLAVGHITIAALMVVGAVIHGIGGTKRKEE